MYLADHCDLNPGSCICWLCHCQENDFSSPTLSFLCVEGTAVVSCHKRTRYSAWLMVHASDMCCCHGPLLSLLNRTPCWGQFTGMRNTNTKWLFPIYSDPGTLTIGNVPTVTCGSRLDTITTWYIMGELAVWHMVVTFQLQVRKSHS